MHKTDEEIALALSQFRHTLDRHGVNVDHTVISDIISDLIYEKIHEQLSQTVLGWDLNSLLRIKNVVNEPIPIEQPQKRGKSKKVVQ